MRRTRPHLETAHRPRRARHWIVLAVTLLVQAATVRDARAHDFWVQPETYRPTIPSTLGIGLRVGEHFGHGEAYPRNPAHVVDFVIAGPAGIVPVLGSAGADPAGVVRVETPGVYVIAYRSAQSRVTLDATVFEHYLAAERQEEISRLRLARGESAAPGREAFSRCAKAIVVAGAAPDEGYDRILGLTLELVPERNPATLAPGAELPVRLLFDGAPLTDAYVAAMNAAEPGTRIERRTGADGRVRLPLGRGGLWLVRSLRMTAAPPGSGVDWESVWTSLTFIVAP